MSDLQSTTQSLAVLSTHVKGLPCTHHEGIQSICVHLFVTSHGEFWHTSESGDPRSVSCYSGLRYQKGRDHVLQLMLHAEGLTIVS